MESMSVQTSVPISQACTLFVSVALICEALGQQSAGVPNLHLDMRRENLHEARHQHVTVESCTRSTQRW